MPSQEIRPQVFYAPLVFVLALFVLILIPYAWSCWSDPGMVVDPADAPELKIDGSTEWTYRDSVTAMRAKMDPADAASFDRDLTCVYEVLVKAAHEQARQNNGFREDTIFRDDDSARANLNDLTAADVHAKAAQLRKAGKGR